MDNEIVEAIEEGKIVKVSKEYARREGLLVLKKYEPPKMPEEDEKQPFYTRYKVERRAADLDKYRKPLKIDDEITSSLVNNFGWVVSSKRRENNISRKQLAEAIHISEEDLKMFELGRIVRNDYVLVNKLEDYLKIVLRKDPNVGKIKLQPTEHRESRFLREHKSRESNSENEGVKSHMVSGDIEIIDSVD